MTRANFDTYQMMRIDEAPAIEVHVIDGTEAPGGMGEPATACVAPAVVDAVFAAAGNRLRKMVANSCWRDRVATRVVDCLGGNVVTSHELDNWRS